MEREKVELNERDFEELAIRLTAIKKSCEKEKRNRTKDEEFFVRTVNGEVYEAASEYINELAKSFYKKSRLLEFDDLYDTCVAVLFENFPKYRANVTLNDFIKKVFDDEISKEADTLYTGKKNKGFSDSDFEFFAKEISKINKNDERTDDEKFFVKRVNEKLFEKMEPVITKFVTKYFKPGTDEYDNLFNTCVVAMFDNFPKYKAESGDVQTFFTKVFKNAKKTKERKGMIVQMEASEVINKDASEITNTEFEMLAKEIGKIRKACEDRNRTPEEETFVKQANGKLYEKMQKYVFDFVHKTYPTYYKDDKEKFDDLCNTCITTLFDRFPEYRANIDLPVFFARWFKGDCNTYLGRMNGKTRYYNNKSNIINRAIKELVSMGFVESEITVTDIYKQLLYDGVTNISTTVISNTLSIDNVKFEPLSDNNAEREDIFSVNPEAKMLSKEMEEQIKSILSVLNPAERIAYLLNVGYYNEETGFVPEKTLTAKQISMYPVFLHALLEVGDEKNIVAKKSDFYDSLDDELKEYFTDKACVSADFVTATIAKARRKIKNHPLVLKEYDKASDTYGVYATEEDVMASVQSIEDILKDM